MRDHHTRYDWDLGEVLALFEPLNDLLFRAGTGSTFCGDQLSTMPNPSFDTDLGIFDSLGIKATAAA